MTRYPSFFAFVLLALLVTPASPKALDLGLTPSHVYSLWVNINNSLITASRVISGDSNLRTTLIEMKPEKISGKTPADVLDQLGLFREKLNRLLLAENLPRVARTASHREKITPSDVYLNSGYILNAQMKWLIVRTGPEQSISHFYTRHGFAGKTPSDVFGLVDLANRRVDKLLAKAGF